MQEKKSTDKKASETARDPRETAREAAGRAQESYSSAAEGFREYQLKLISVAQANANAIFEYAQDVLQAQSITELIELSGSHSRRQFEMMAEQTRELVSSAQKMATDAARPLTSALGSPGAQMS